MSDSVIRWTVRFHGNVQNVGFRATTRSLAQGLAVHGFVRNESDGTVWLDVEGEAKEVHELIRRIESELAHRIHQSQKDALEPTGRNAGFNIAY